MTKSTWVWSVLVLGAGAFGCGRSHVAPAAASPSNDAAARVDRRALIQDDLAADFSSICNPSPTGHFTYAWAADASGAFVPFDKSVPIPGLATTWQSGLRTASYPLIYRSKDGRVVLHPGENGERSVVVWRSPRAGKFHVVGAFASCDRATTDVAVEQDHPGHPLVSGNVSGDHPVSFNRTLELTAGESLEFSVGPGPNGYGQDSTCLDLAINEQ